MIVVIGAVALDVVACRERFLPGTSNPATIRWQPGGVGYRIWRRLPAPKRFITAVGEDPAGRWLAGRLRAAAVAGAGQAGLDAGRRPRPQAGAGRAGSAAPPRRGAHSGVRLLVAPRLRTACYCAFMEAGRLLYGAADMRVIERGLAWARVASLLPELGPADLLVMEANLAPSLVSRVIGRHGKRTRLVFESVSVEKLLRHEPHLSDLYLLSANREELAALRSRLAPGSTRNGAGWLRAFLGERGIAHLLVPRGRQGARLYRLGPRGRLEVTDAPPRRLVAAADTTGAGDLLLSALLSRLGGRRGPAQALPEAMREVERALKRGRL
jgi:sugar/nucleoside kinase (ribokinase family)